MAWLNPVLTLEHNDGRWFYVFDFTRRRSAALAILAAIAPIEAIVLLVADAWAAGDVIGENHYSSGFFMPLIWPQGWCHAQDEVDGCEGEGGSVH